MENAQTVIGDATLADRLFTIGHSTHEPEVFLALLRGAGITAIADVRSSPYSRRLPHFSKGPLQGFLSYHGIAYVFLGNELGGRPSSPSLYDAEGWADYERMRGTESFAQGLDRLLRGLERYTIAMLCGEEDPLDCHRGLMITPALVERGLPPKHIRKGGLIETTAEVEARLLEMAGLGSLFREALVEAYRLMNRKKAYRLDREEQEE